MELNSTVAFLYCGVALVCTIILIYNSIIVSKITPRYSISRYVVFAFFYAGLSAIFDCVYILRESGTIIFSNTSNYILTTIYVLASTLTGACWVIYSEKKQNSALVKTKKRFILYCIPIAISLIVVILTPFTHWYFYFEDGHYVRGSIFLILSSLMFIYVVQTGIVALINSFKKENYVNRYEYRRLFAFAVVYTGIQAIQLALPDVFPYRSIGLMLMYDYFLVQNMKELIGHDPLTHINNRFEAERMLGTLLNNKVRSEVVLLDIDKFKNINDTYGHQEGDKALQYLSLSLIESVDESCFIARMGGDEFIIINSNPSNSIIDIEEKINNQLNIILEQNNCKYRFSVSAGYALKDETISSIPDIISLADSKMYERKQQKSHSKKERV